MKIISYHQLLNKLMAQSTDSKFADQLKEEFGDKIIQLSDYRGDLTLILGKTNLHFVAKVLKTSSKFEMNQMIDLTAVDYLNQNIKPRFQVVYHLLSLTKGYRLRIKCNLEESDLTIDSISDLWAAANWYERECFDMYGVIFNNHPALARILLYPEFKGHPLRKDYPIEKEQPLVRLKEVNERHQYLINKNL